MRQPRTRRELEVWEACEALYAANQKLTGDAIRDKLADLGHNKGSFTQVYQYRNSWQSQQGITDLKNFTATNNDQPALPDPLLRAVAAIREELKADAEHRIEAIKTEMMEALEKANQRYEENQRTIESLQTSIERITHENKELKTAYQTLTEAHQTLQKAQAATEARANTLQEQLTATQAEVDKAHQEAKQDAENKEKQHQSGLKALRDTHEEQRHQWMLENDALKTTKNKLETQIILLQKEKEMINANYSKLETQHKNLEETLEIRKKQNNESQQKISEITQEQYNLESELGILKQQNEDWKALYENSQQKLLEQQTQLGKLEQQVIILQNQKTTKHNNK